MMANVTTYSGRRALDESVGERMALIRVAIGGSIRDQISQEALGDLVGWDKYKVSRLERGAQPLSRDDAIALAKVDPLRRGPGWVMFGDQGGEGGQGAPLTNGGHTPRTGSPQTIHVEKTYPAELQPRPQKKKIRRRPPNDRTARAG